MASGGRWCLILGHGTDQRRQATDGLPAALEFGLRVRTLRKRFYKLGFSRRGEGGDPRYMR